MIRFQTVSASVLIGYSALSAPPAVAQSTWTGGSAVDSNWSTAANWSGGTPVSASTAGVTLAGTTRLTPNQNIANPFSLNSLTFDSTAGSFNLGGNGLNFLSNGATLPTLTQGSANGQMVSVPLTLTNNLTVGGGGTGALTLAGAVTGAGSLTMAGSYTLTLSGAGSSFSGGLYVNGGTVQLGASNVLTAAGPAVTVAGGAFNLGGFSQTIGSLALGPSATVNPTVSTGAGTLTLGGNLTFSGGAGNQPAVISGNLNLGGAVRTVTVSVGTTAAYDVVIGAAVGGSGGLVENGGSTIASLALNAVNSYTGPTTINDGTLTVGVANALPATTNLTLGTSLAHLVLNPSTTAQGVNAGVYDQTIASLAGVTGSVVSLGSNAGGATLTINQATNTTFAGAIQAGGVPGIGMVIKAGAGILNLSGTNTYSGGTTISGGVLQLGASGALNSSGAVTVTSGTFDLNGFDQTIFSLALGPSTTANPTVSTGAGTLTLNTGNGAGNITFAGGTGTQAAVLAGNLNLGNLGGAARTITISTPSAAPYDVVLGAALSGNAGLVLDGDPGGRLALTGANTYTGSTTINNGTLFLGAANTLPATTGVTLANANTALVLNPGTTALGVTAGNYNQSIGSLTGVAGSTLNLGSATLTVGTGNFAGNLVGGTLVEVAPFGFGLTLSGTNSQTATIVNSGTLTVSADAGLGAAGAPLTVNGLGTLTLNYSFNGLNLTTGRTFTLNNGGTMTVASGQAVNLNGCTIIGGFLAGPGEFDLSGGTTVDGVTTAPSAIVTANSFGGLVTLQNVTNGGILNVFPNPPNPFINTVSFIRLTNQGSGSITVPAGTKLNVSDFQTYGVVTLGPGSATNPTALANTGTTPMYFNGGSRTFISISSHAGQFDAGIDLHGQNAVVAGGLFVNNGYVVDSVGAGTKTVIADFGSLVKGAGFYQNSVQTVNGGKFQSGNSPGKATFGSFTFGPGGVSNYVFAIDDATGTAGPSPNANGQVSGWGLVKAVQRPIGSVTTPGDFTWTADPAHPLTIHLDTLVNPTTVGTDVGGPMADFDATKPYWWPAVQWTGNYSGPANAAALNAATAFDTTGFANPIAGTFGWSFGADGRSLSLTYTPATVPEPGTLASAAIGGLAAGWAAQRRRRTT
jgi:autotransporter-associated beta strand protein